MPGLRQPRLKHEPFWVSHSHCAAPSAPVPLWAALIAGRRLDECLVALQALAVLNQRLSAEITAYAAACRHSFQDNEAWRLRCDALAKQLRLARGTGGADRVSDQLALAQLLDEAQRASEANALLLQPSDDNDALLQALVRRGAAAGWLIDASEVARRQPLGKGTFGTTYLATWRGAEVAVKCCSPREPRDLVSFLREVDALACVRHPNVLPFVGACLDQAPADLWLVTDFMPGGTLEEWIYGPGGAAAAAAAGATRAPPPPGRSLLQKLHMAWDVAKGMAACEALRPAPLAHRDLKPANVYIDGAGRGRVGDFGLAKRLLAEQVANLTGSERATAR